MPVYSQECSNPTALIGTSKRFRQQIEIDEEQQKGFKLVKTLFSLESNSYFMYILQIYYVHQP